MIRPYMENGKTKKGKKVTLKPLPIEINQKEICAIIHETQKMHHRVAFALSWASGLRITELVNLQQEDFDFYERSIRVNMGKNSKDRIIPMPKFFTEAHLKYIPIKCKQRSLQKAFKYYAEKAGVLKNKPKAHFHSLRHGFATHCVRCGINLVEIQGHLGHADVSTTSIYTNLAPKERLDNYQEKFGGLTQSCSSATEGLEQ